MVKVENISFSYDRTSNKILDDVSFDIEKFHCLAILGNNGAGKSTLIKCIDRIYSAQHGAVYVEGNNVFTMARDVMAKNIAYVPQSSSQIDMTVYDLILLGRKPYIKWAITSEDRDIVDDIIHQMNLDELVLRNVSQLSGGELQRVALARALAQQPKLLLLDEPTSNLDPYNQHDVLRAVRNIAHDHGVSVAIIIHDLNLAIRYCDRFLFLKDAEIYSYGDLDSFTPETIEAVYGVRVHIIDYMGIPVVVPFLDENA